MTYDLILVGTSFASSFFLRKYLEMAPKNVTVLVLERGNFIPHAQRLDQTRSKPRSKVRIITGGDTEKTYRSDNPGKPWLFDPSFGGSSNSWTGCTPRLMPYDFKMRSKYNVGSDWPLSYEDLESFYCEAEEIMSISGPENTPYPMSKPYPQPAHELSTIDKIMHREYGDLYIGQPTARSSISGKRNKCCTSAVCHICPMNAKFTIENGLMPIYDDHRVTVLTDSQVIRLETERNVVKDVVYIKEGIECRASGDAIALGANPIFNAHILLNSGDTSPFTGRFLSEQVGFPVYVYLNDLKNVGGNSFITCNGYMLYDTVDRGSKAACLLESHNGFYIRHEYGKWRHIAKFKFVFEDIPQHDNFVSLSDDPQIPLITYKNHSRYVTNGYNHLKNNLNKLLSPLPVESICIDEKPVPTEGHILGTTRMSADASSGVIDKYLIHHKYRNLFVLGTGAFPSISPSNPTLTLSALSLWSAHHMFK